MRFDTSMETLKRTARGRYFMEVLHEIIRVMQSADNEELPAMYSMVKYLIVMGDSDNNEMEA